MRAELVSEDAILFLEIVDDVALLQVDPSGERHDDELQGLAKRRHIGASVPEAHGCHESRSTA